MHETVQFAVVNCHENGRHVGVKFIIKSIFIGRGRPSDIKRAF